MGRMSNTQFLGFQKEVEKLETRLKGVYVTSYSLSGSGAAESQFSECYKDCHNSFPGTGGGNGFNRFACKIGCFAEAAGGGNGNN